MATTSDTAGTFTCAELVKVTVAIDRVWADNQTNQDFASFVEVLNVIKSKQTARLSELEDPAKDKTIKVYWATDCNTSLSDCSDDCSVGGPELEARCKEYALDLCKKAGFTVREKTFRNSNLSREEVVAKGMIKRMKELDEYLAQTMVAKLDAFAGVNQFAGIGTVVGDGSTYILPSFWTADLVGYFTQVAIMNKLAGAYVIHGNNLWNTKWQADMNNGNANNKDQAAKMNSIQQFWDPFNIDTVNTPDKVSYLISSGAVAFSSKAYNPSSPVTYMDDIRWSVQSKSIPGVYYDVVYKNRCLSNEIYHDYTLYVNAGIFNNPYGCDEEVTGVLKFVCGDGSLVS
jgi:hypothetical protein